MSLLCALAAAVGGCGADEEHPDASPNAEDQVRAVVAKFGIATRGKDYQTICDQLLSATLVQKIEAVGLPCEGALQRGLGDVKAPTLEITDVSLSPGKALVSVHTTAAGQEPSNDALQLVRENGAWKIASLAGANGTSTTTTSTTTTSTTPTTTTKTTKKKKSG
ncbi:hypothetical protein DSM104299_01907 [Baekduia alba]|nr:hypothetical protein DSM104299_01907 [Baekduia alba]